MKKYDLKKGELVTINWRSFHRLRDNNDVVDGINITSDMWTDIAYASDNIFTISAISRLSLGVEYFELLEDSQQWIWPKSMFLRVGPKRMKKLREKSFRQITI